MNWQQQSTHFAHRYNLQHSPQVHALDLVSELGEVSKELLKATKYGTSDPHYRPEMAEEFGDVLYSLCLLAESVGVDLESALQSTLAKYEQRWQAKGHIGSQIVD